ncbi:MAG TPA: redoxin domain-containing protein [Burkholderiales bacterium]|nr:redoxin domain-containing protein [Burkholderiales bacterium]
MPRLLAVLLFLSVASAPVGAADPQAKGTPKREAPVAVGDLAPDFTLEDQDGRRHSLSAQRGKQPVVLVFYRGYW